MSTIDKALDALFVISESRTAMRLTDIAAALKLPRSTTHRLLIPLVTRALVEQDEKSRYRSGVGLIALGLNGQANEPIAALAQPILEAAAYDLGETFFLVVSRGGRLVVLEKAEGNGFLRAAPRLGSEVPVHATAVGKLFLAFDPLFSAPDKLERFTANTVRSRAALHKQIGTAAKQAWAINDEEWQTGLSVIAASVVAGGRLIACVALAMVAARFHELGQRAALRHVRHAADGIAIKMERKTK